VSYLRRFGLFWWEFIVGDNLPLALGAGIAIGITAWLVHVGLNAWWFLPPAILALLAGSVLVAARSRRGRRKSRSESGHAPMARPAVPGDHPH
jgi:hypothetical protein